MQYILDVELSSSFLWLQMFQDKFHLRTIVFPTVSDLEFYRLTSEFLMAQEE